MPTDPIEPSPEPTITVGTDDGNPPEPSPAPAPVVDPTELATLRAAAAELAAIRAAEAARQAVEADAARQRAVDAEVNQHRTAAEQANARYQASIRDRDLALALSGFDLVPGAASQLTALHAGRLVVVAEGDGYVVRGPDGSDLAGYLKDVMARPECEHFLRATGRGGVGASGGDKKSAAPEPPRTLGEAWAAAWIAHQAQQPRGLGLGGKPIR